jgi:hypothetical protein
MIFEVPGERGCSVVRDQQSFYAWITEGLGGIKCRHGNSLLDRHRPIHHNKGGAGLMISAAVVRNELTKAIQVPIPCSNYPTGSQQAPLLNITMHYRNKLANQVYDKQTEIPSFLPGHVQ